jgi:hypothetical protein
MDRVFQVLVLKGKSIFFYCKKLGHAIKECKARIVAKANPRKQKNIFIKDNKLYVATYFANEKSDLNYYNSWFFLLGF